MTNSIADLEESDCFLIIGSNTTENHPLVARRIIIAKERGAKVIVADPRRTHIAQMADLILSQRPGSDVALLNGMMNVILRDGLQDDQFIKNRTKNFEEFKKVIDQYPPERASEISGVPVTDIVQAAHLYGKAAAAAVVYCMGITQHTSGVDNVKSCANLAMITGNLGRPGTGVNPLRGQNNVQGACDMGALPNVLTGYQPVLDDTKRAGVEQVWACHILAKLGLTETGMIDAAVSGDLKGLYIMGENPVQRMYQAVAPPGQALPDWEIITKLAKRMGVNGFDFDTIEAVYDEARSVTPQYKGITYQRAWRCRFAMALPQRGAPRHTDSARWGFHLGTGSTFPDRIPGISGRARCRIPVRPDHRTFLFPLPHRNHEPPFGNTEQGSVRSLRGDQPCRCPAFIG